VNDQALHEARRLAAAKIRGTKTQVCRQARQLGVDLVQLADKLESEDYPSVNPFGAIGETGRLLDLLMTRYDSELQTLGILEEIHEVSSEEQSVRVVAA
jgi:hypothetical protein